MLDRPAYSNRGAQAFETCTSTPLLISLTSNQPFDTTAAVEASGPAMNSDFSLDDSNIHLLKNE